jgi:deoxyribose-phosphate aldolase
MTDLTTVLETSHRLLDGPPTEARLHELIDGVPHVAPEELEPWVSAQLAQACPPVDLAGLGVLTGLIDLTSLAPDDTPERVRDLVARAVRPAGETADAVALPPTAAVCLHADFVAPARQALDAADAPVALAAVAGGFPHGRSPLAAKVAEVRHAVDCGADEIDIVIDRGALVSGRLADVHAWVLDARRLVERGDGSRALLKVILETCELPSYYLMLAGAFLALLGGADFVKTSTGKGRRGATPEAAAVLLQAVAHWEAETGQPRGVKIAGGVRTVDQAAGYVRLARTLLGDDAISPARLRFGASGLLDDVVRRLDPLR